MEKGDIIIICFIVLMLSAVVALGISDSQSRKTEKDYTWLSGYNACITDVLNNR